MYRSLLCGDYGYEASLRGTKQSRVKDTNVLNSTGFRKDHDGMILLFPIIPHKTQNVCVLNPGLLRRCTPRKDDLQPFKIISLRQIELYSYKKRKLNPNSIHTLHHYPFVARLSQRLMP